MRETRQSGSEGGAAQTNAPFLPLSEVGFELGEGDGCGHFGNFPWGSGYQSVYGW
jgi:hypothetical protein